jgi:4-hydroxybenzoate polyprenyltransferase
MITHKIKSYIELARLDKPAGYLLLFWPCAWAIILASTNSATLYYNLILFFIGAVSMRSAGCIINDIIDRKIDAQVTRTKNRPLASGRLKLSEALLLLTAMLLIGLHVFLRINDTAKFISFIALLLAVIYPLTKRFFSFPQLFLGLAFSSGALVAWAQIAGDINYAAFLLYLGGIFWTIGYDTIYAHQDKTDDIKAGVKSTAITFGTKSSMIIWAFLALAYVFITEAALYMNDESLSYIYCIPALIHMMLIMKDLDLKNPANCMKKFNKIAYITGVLFTAGLYISKII